MHYASAPDSESDLASVRDSHPRFHYGWVILVLGVLTVFAALGLARFGYTMILPPMQEGLKLDNTEAGALATGNLIGYLCLALVGGALAARFSPRRVIAISVFVVGVTMILTGTSIGFYPALVWRTLTGMGSGGSNVPVMALLAAWFAKERRGLATGVAVTGSSVGLIVVGPLVPWIENLAGPGGWRVSWVVLGGMVCAVGLLCWFFLRNTPQESGLEPIRKRSDPNAVSADSGAGQPASAPVAATSWGQVYRSGAVAHLAIIYVTFGFSYIIFVTFFAKYLQAERGYTKEQAGQFWQIIGWLSFLCGVLWGWVSDVLGRKYALATVCFLQGAAYVMFALWTQLPGVIVAVILFGLTAWSIPALMAAACGDRVGPRLAPAALGYVTFFFGIGQALGPVVAGHIADEKNSLVPALVCAGLVAASGGVASLFLKRTQ